MDIQQRDFEVYNVPSYIRGQWRKVGWWYYYLYAVAIKVPLSLWVLGILLLIGGVTRKFAESGTNSASPAAVRDQIILLFPAAVIFIVVSFKYGFSEHMRYVLPVFPFLFVWVSACCSTVGTQPQFNYLRIPWRNISIPFSSVILFCAGWFVTSSLSVYPHSLSYFNESIGGPLNGPKHLLGSNVDWGQDLRFLGWWIKDRPRKQTNGLAYLGLFDPADMGFADVLPIDDKAGKRIAGAPGAFAISVNLLYGFPALARDGQSKTQNGVDENLLQELRTATPIARAGYSIWIFP
jgi:hypothetical protein